MSKSAHESAAQLLIETQTTDGLNTLGLVNGISDMDLKVYFWQPSDLNLLLANINDVNSKRANQLGLNQGPDSIQTLSSTIMFDVLAALSLYKDIGAIKSYQVVSTPLNANNEIADLSFLQANLPSSRGTTLGTTAISDLGKAADFNNESIIGLNPALENDWVDQLRWVVLHEIGHALGLSHPRAVLGIPYEYDNFKYTMMSYNNDNFKVTPDSPMLLDYLALQKSNLLGAYRTGDADVFIRTSTFGFYHTIYDTAGSKDSISAASRQEANIIDLRDGHFSSYGGNIDGKAPLENLAIAYDTIIENAVGGDKDDVIIGNSTSNELKGGKGDDFIYGNGENYKTDNWKFSDAHKNAYTATVDTEYTTGDSNDKDTIYGGEGNDYIAGESGDDTLYGDEGYDFIFGGMGDDTLEGGADADHLYGGDGTFAVVDGADILNGGDGNDILEGGSGNDTYLFTGTFGRDVIKDSDGTIKIEGALVSAFTQTTKEGIIYYNDANNPTQKAIVINEGTTQSLIISTVTKSGNSIIDSGNSVTIKNWVSGQLGINLLLSAEIPATTPVYTATSNDSGNAISVGNAGDLDPNYVLKNYSTLYADGGKGHDVIMGLQQGNDRLSGGDGDDIISGGFTTSISGSINMSIMNNPGIDDITGGIGDDFIVVTAGSTAHGNEDNDTLMASLAFYIAFNGENRDTCWQDIRPFLDVKASFNENTNTYTTGLRYKTLTANFQEFTSVTGDKKFIARITNNAITFAYNFTKLPDGTYGYDNPGLFDLRSLPTLLTEGHTYDELANQAGANLFGDAGDDFLNGGLRADYLSGGADKDVIFGDYGNDVLDGGTGDDTLMGDGGNDLIIGGTGIDKLYGGDDKDTLYGGDGADMLSGDAGDDYLDGGTGADTLYGEEGKDYLYGGDDILRDYLIGGDDNDVMIMGKLDRAEGGAGNDTYIWDTHQVTTTPTNPENTFIIDIEGNNTLALVGIHNMADLAVDSSYGSLLINVGNNQEIVISYGLTLAPFQIMSGNSVEQVASGANSFTAITDDTFLNGSDLLAQPQMNTAGLVLSNLQRAIVLTASDPDSYFAGGLLGDTLTANSGGTHFIGGRGDDILKGEVGNDNYLIRQGDGNDTITEKGGSNTIKFAKNISATQLTTRRSGADLLITFSDEQTIAVKNMFDAATGALITLNSIQNIKFYDNVNWDLTTIKQQALASTTGDDVISGYDSVDTLTGGKGSDKLIGAAGNDVYQFAFGDGNDIIVDTSGNDRLEFTSGVLQDQLTAYRDGYNSLILRLNNGEKITVTNAFDTSGNFTSNAIETIKFSDTSTWDSARIKQETLNYTGHIINDTAGVNDLVGDTGKDVFTGGKGNDTIFGDAGDDIYRYTLGDGNDVIIDTAGIDHIEFSDIPQAQVVARHNGSDLILTLSDGGAVTVKDMFVNKSQTAIDPAITSIIQQLQTNWLSQAEILIENYYGLVGSGNLTLNFTRETLNAYSAQIEILPQGINQTSNLVLSINLDKFSVPPNGVGPWYYDRTIAHEMVHAVMASNNMSVTTMPGWFLEGTAEFIQGGDERVKNDLSSFKYQSTFNTFFKTTAGAPTSSPGYSVSYIAVKLLDDEIRASGGVGIKDLFAELKIGKTLDESLAAISTRFENINGLWNSLTSFETHFRAVGFTSMNTLLNLNNADTGSVAGSDYGNPALDANSIISNTNIGSSKYFNVIVPQKYTSAVGIFNQIESITFADGTWDAARIKQELLRATNNNDDINGFDSNDTISGGLGHDQLNGGAGDDTYKYALGDGNDVITDILGADQIQLTTGIDQTQVKARRDSANNLVLTMSDGGTITVIGAFDAAENFTTNAIETIKFLDDSIWDLARIKQQVIKSGQILTALDYENLVGTPGNDTLIASGTSNQLMGKDGDDTYVINAGGIDYYIDDNDGNNTLQFGPGITKDQVTFYRTRHGDLDISLDQSNAYVTLDMFINDQTSAGEYVHPAVQLIKFDNGDQFSLQDIKDIVTTPTSGDDEIYGFETDDTLRGGAGDDDLYSFFGDDTLYGDAGDDRLVGGTENDTYVIGKNSGNDIIYDSAGVDTVKFTDDIMQSDVKIKFSGDLKIFAGNNSVSLGIIRNYLEEIDLNLVVEKIEFSDNSQVNIVDMLKVGIEIASTEKYLGKYFYGSGANDSFVGTTGADIISSLIGNDTINGGAGNDKTFGGTGDDVYKVNIGDGIDNITDVAGNDGIEFGAGILANQIHIKAAQSSSGWDTSTVVISTDQGNTININNMFDVSGKKFLANNSLEYIKFANGEVWTQERMLQELLKSKVGIQIIGSSNDEVREGAFGNDNISGGEGIDILRGLQGADILKGDGGNDVLEGGAGEDVLEGAVGNDWLDGGTHNDRLDGGSDNDTYYFELNDGNDVINDTSGIDTIKFSAEINASDVKIESFGYGYIDFVYGPNDKVTVANMLHSYSGYETANSIEFIEFGNGEKWNLDQIKRRISFAGTENSDYLFGTDLSETFTGGAGGDHFDGNDGDDSFVGGAGNDVLEGGRGNNTYTFNLGDGKDYIYSGSYASSSGAQLYSQDTIILGAGIIPEDVVAYPLNSRYENRIVGFSLYIGNNGDEIHIFGEDRSNNSRLYGSYNIVFSDGTIWTDNGSHSGLQITHGSALDETPPPQPTAEFDPTGKIISGKAEAGSTISVKNASAVELGTIVANATTGAYSITLPTALINTETVNVTAKDAAGNISVPKAITAPDLTKPLPPTAFFNATGTAITGNAEKSSRVHVYNAANVSIGNIKASSSTGNYIIVLTTPLTQGEVVRVVANDAAGNISLPASATAPLITSGDTTPPTPPTAEFDPTGKIIFGQAEAGSTVSVKNASAVELGTIVANATTGAYSITLPTALINTETVNITAKDAAGNISPLTYATAPLIASGDTTPPTPPTAAFDITGKIISGKAEAGSTVSVKNASAVELGTIVANATTGLYSITLPTALINTETVNVTAKDAAGNISTPKAINAPDLTGPLQPSADFNTAGTIITGNAEKSSRVHVYNAANVSIGNIKASSSTGNYTIALATPLTQGETVKVIANDAAGNISPAKEITAPVLTTGTAASFMTVKMSAPSSATAQADALIQAMAAFAPPTAAQTKTLIGYYDNNQPMLASHG